MYRMLMAKNRQHCNVKVHACQLKGEGKKPN